MGCLLKMTKVEIEKISDPDKYMFLKKEWEVELVILIKDIAKEIMNIVKIIIKKNLKNILFILTEQFIWACNESIFTMR